jgi:thiamine monophosphate synthase
MSTQPTPRLVTSLKPKYEVKVDLDDRAFLFPAGKSLAQLVYLSDGHKIYLEAAYHDPEDARELARRLVEAVHTARMQLAITAGVRITINVVANGYHLQIGDMNDALELFLGTGCIWRVCQGLLRIIDLIAPVESN